MRGKWIFDSTIQLCSIDSLLVSGSWDIHGNLCEKQLIERVYLYFKDIKDFTCIDIGANLGSYSFLASEIPNSLVYAFEPHNVVFNHFKKCLQLNASTNHQNKYIFDNKSIVKIENIALSDKIEEKQLKIPDKCGSGLSCLSDNPTRFATYSKQTIQTTTLDVFLENEDIMKIDFIKIDTEGWEYYILQGALNTIKKYKPKLQLELWDENLKQCGLERTHIFNLLNDLDYEYKFISKAEIWCEPRKHC